MSELHWGEPEHPSKIAFLIDGYHYKCTDDTEYRFIRYPEPQWQERRIRAMYGFSIFHRFSGYMKLGKVEK